MFNVTEPVFQLSLSLLLGALIGFERKAKKKEAGLQTHSLVALSSCFATIIAFEMFKIFGNQTGVSFDPVRVIQSVLVGIGFLGAGVIFHQPSGLVGLTTGAGLWTSSIIGIAVGVKMYSLAIFVAFLALFVLLGFGLAEQKFFNKD